MPQDASCGTVFMYASPMLKVATLGKTETKKPEAAYCEWRSLGLYFGAKFLIILRRLRACCGIHSARLRPLQVVREAC